METAILEDIGLTASEIKVYFALLELETSTVGPIIDKAKVPDSKIYSILEKLKEKGLASYVIKNKVKHFQSTDPKNLVNILKEKQEAITKQRKQLEETIIPQIEQRRKLTEEKQEAQVYESIDGVKAAFNLILETLHKGEEYSVFMLGESLEEKKLIRFFQNYHKKRIAKGIKVNLLSQKKFRDVVKKSYGYKQMTVRFTSKTLPIGTFIFKNHVMTMVWGERPTAFVIKSKKNYQYYKAFFESIWRHAKP